MKILVLFPLKIIDTNPSFEFTSTQGQSYSVNVRINNINTSCYGEDTFDNLLTISANDNEIQEVLQRYV